MPDVLLTFDDLSAGDIVNGQYSSQGVTISSGNHANPTMVFDTSNPTGGDHDLQTNNLGNVLILSEDGDSNDPDDNASGGNIWFTFDEPSEVINFNVLDIEEAGGEVCLFDGSGNLMVVLPLTITGNNCQGVMNIGYDNVSSMLITLPGSGAIDNICFRTPESEDELDGVVTGSAGADVIDNSYDGDPEGDFVDNNDAILPGETGDDDIIDALGGNDTITAGNGDDEVYAGSGDDTVTGGAGNDVIYGDSNYDGSGAGGSVRESLNWDQEGSSLSDFVQDTGNVNVTFTVLDETGAADTRFEGHDQLVSGIDSGTETINDNSSMYSVTNGDHGSAEYQLGFSNEVENVEFRVNDIDGDGVVRIKAYDEDGNQIEIDLAAGGSVSLSDTDGVAGADRATSNGGYAPDTAGQYSLLVSIPGPVARIVIEHDQNGGDNSGINITDVFFDAPVADTGAAGNDILSGGAGNDVIYGEDGNDTIDGGDGDDTITGGQGFDVIDGGEGADTISGGLGNDEIDGGIGNDTLSGDSGNDTIDGGDGNDDITGGTGDDIITGGDGDDDILGESGSDTVDGGDGNDVIDTSGSGPQPDLGYPGLYPGDPDPLDDRDTVMGGAGNDTITTGDDDDIIDGGTGDDIIDGGFDKDTIDGGDGDDRIVGGEGSDTILGGEGNDTIYAGNDPDLGLDSLNIEDDGTNLLGPDLVTNNGMDFVDGGAGNDTIFGADDDDTLLGGTGDDYIDGGIDDDTIEGGDGDDTIIGGQGVDELSGGFGNDTFLGGNGGLTPGSVGDNVVGGEDADGNDVDVLDLTGSDVASIDYTPGDAESGTVNFLDGTTMTFSEIENVIPCFTPGSTIATPKGERLVEELVEGDKIITRDNGTQEIRWVGQKALDARDLMANPHLKPVLIRQGALGNGLPERDMMVSPNHRVLVANEKTALYFEENEVLAAAQHLVGAEGIHNVDVLGTTYIHMMFDRHEVVLSNGAWTESFQPGDYTLKGIGNGQRAEILELFPELKSQEGIKGYHAARRSLKKHEAKLLVK